MLTKEYYNSFGGKFNKKIDIVEAKIYLVIACEEMYIY